jgi:putative phosphoesterase
VTGAARVAILSDVHADIRALEDALAVIDRLGADRIFCAGDLVDYGAHPDDTLALLRDRKIPCIRGNHDRWAAGSRLVRTGWDPARDSMEFLRTLPTRIDETIEGVRVAIRHGTPSSDMRGVWPIRTSRAELAGHLEETASDILVVGHTHLPFRLDVSGVGSIVNPGALLREPTGRVAMKPILFDPDRRRFVTGPGPGGGTFGILELPSRQFTVHRAQDGSKVRAIELVF